MYLVGDLGFSSLVLVVSLVLPVIGFIIRRNWRNSVSRKEEIQRLLVFAAQEDARVEYEASLGYGAVPVSRVYHQCEVCFSPTTTRCARCKSVRYCSAKCQIVHWRRGHKEECRPPSYAADRNNDMRSDNYWGSDFSQKIVEECQHGGSEIEGSHHARPAETSPGEMPLSGTPNSDGVLHRKGDDSKVEYQSDRDGADCASETCSSSFSGFSTSPSRVDSFDDSSVCESISSNEHERLDRSQSVDTELNMLWSASTANGVDQTNPLSPRFTSLVNSVDKFSKPNQVKSDSGESKRAATISSDLGTSGACESHSAKDDASTSSVRDQTLEPNVSGNKGRNESSLSNSRGGRKSLSSDSESTLQFSFSLSGDSSPSLDAQGSKVKGVILNDPAPAASSEKVYVETHSFSSLKRERSNQAESVSKNGSRVSKSRDVEVLPNSSINLSCGSNHGSIIANNISSNGLQPSNSEKSGRTFHDSSQTIHAPSSREASRLSACANSRSSSNVKLESVPSVKSEKVDVVHAVSATSLPVASSNGRQGLKTSVRKAVDQFRGSKLPKHDHIGSENEVAGRYREKGLFSYELFVKLYNWNKVELLPCGLSNCGNSCYANVVLQCLAFTPPLTSYFLQGRHSKSCVNKQWCFTCEFENLILKAKEGKSVLSPIGILSQLQNIGSRLGNGKEEDAHEFLRYAIDTMQSVCLKEAGVNRTGSSEEETTLVGLTFGGYLRSKIKCMKCRSKSERQERMMDLTVEIEGDIGTLEEALRRFTATEVLDGENKYQCSRCKSYEKAKKKLTILEAPNVLTIALKRFQSGKFGKLNKPIRFPEILNLAPYMSGTSDRSPVYRLYGVVVHLDIMNAAFSGHYVCYVKNIQNKWFKIDDRTVTNADLERVLMKGAYMLLYARCSPRAPRLIRSKITSPDTKTKTKNPSSNSTPSTHNGASLSQSSSLTPDVPPDIESFYSHYQRLQQILGDDSSSDTSSLLSRNSDECSTSTDSTRDSTSTDDLTEFIFGNSSHGYNSPWSNDSSPSSSSSSPLYGEGKEGDPFSHYDASKHRRKLDARNSCRETNLERLGRSSSSFGSGVPFRRSTSERTE